jgi:hypothetical protein
LILLGNSFMICLHTNTEDTEMNIAIENADEIQPHLMRRTCGGWLAVAPRTALFRIGVTALTEKDVIEKFRFEYGRWVELFKLENT